MSALEIISSREKLFEALGESKTIYLQNMKDWFGKKCSKEEFDLLATELLSPEHIDLHNQFLLAILTKCQTEDAFSQVSPVKSDPPERLRAGRTKGN